MRNLLHSLLASVMMLSTTGCSTTLSPEGFRVVEADERMVSRCTFVGSVEGGSGVGGMSQSTGMQNAKNQAIEAAADRGATHVVIDNVTGGYAPYVNGRAYRC